MGVYPLIGALRETREIIRLIVQFIGDDAKSIASFLSHYSGSESQSVPSTPITLSTK